MTVTGHEGLFFEARGDLRSNPNPLPSQISTLTQHGSSHYAGCHPFASRWFGLVLHSNRPHMYYFSRSLLASPPSGLVEVPTPGAPPVVPTLPCSATSVYPAAFVSLSAGEMPSSGSTSGTSQAAPVRGSGFYSSNLCLTPLLRALHPHRCLGSRR